MIFETTRCVIRKVHDGDFEGMYELQSNPKVMLYSSDDVQTADEVRKDIQYLKSQYEEINPELLVWAITNRSGQFIGTCAVVLKSEEDCEIGYRILERFWGQGFATEVTKVLVSYCQSSYPGRQLCAYCFIENVASGKVLEKAGFTKEREFFNEEEGLQDAYYVIRA